MVTNPIWKDTEYQTTASTLTYSISVDGETIFNGKAYKKPGEQYLKININRICQNYLSNELPESLPAGSNVNTNAVRDFILKNGNGTTLETYRLSYDWSYGDAPNGNINDRYAVGMYGLRTIKLTDSYLNTIIDSLPSTTINACGEYAIYYLDCNGCWRPFLFEGIDRKYDNVRQYEYNRSFNNTTREFERGRYISEIETVYELSTGWLTDAQAENFARNLVGTNMAYLHHLPSGRIFPVVVDEDSVEYKRYVNDRHKVEYTIRVKESQNRIRK